jgi:hypothetical protein
MGKIGQLNVTAASLQGETVAGTLSLRGWVDSRTGLDKPEKR